MTKTLRRIAPLQFAKIAAIGYGLLGLIVVPFFLLGAVASSFAPQPEGNSLAAIGITFSIILSILFPVFYAVMGFIFGLIGAALYNLIAGWVGGIQVEVE